MAKRKELTKKQRRTVLDILGPLPVPQAAKLLEILGYHFVFVDKKVK